MIQRGYIILIAGAVLVVAGIALTAVYGISLAGLVLSNNVILNDISINSSASVNRTLQITDTERPISIALHVESEKDGTEIQTQQQQQQQASNVAIVGEEVRNPSGVVINKNQFNSGSDNNKNDDDGLFTTFKPDVQGEYTIIVTNLGSHPVKVGGIFGYLPIIRNNNQVNLEPLSGIIAGVILFIIGIITLIVGAIIAVLDRRRKKPALT